MTALALYIPALHAGYLKLFEKHAKDVDALFIFNEDLIREFAPKEFRALPAEETKKLVSGLGIFRTIRVLTKNGIAELAGFQKIILADDELSKKFAERFLAGADIVFEPVFLRWDEKNVLSQTPPEDVRVSTDPFDREIMEKAKKEGEKSSDWWRRVGAILVKDGVILLRVHNRHHPSEHTPYIDGDPRDFVEAGTKHGLTTALHAEQTVIAEAARKGIALEGTSIYTAVFPCAVCAKLIAFSGIKKCYFHSGSASLDGERVMKSQGVEIILVK
ncbi:MAG: hypothetical protein UY56_C0002G0014 [Parcubacteria group bacterium GW2011_GWA1_50_14]|uniref:CMP/dCMP-type deaminase domain-containing protein n=1 Tax=Candidatus Liptonbacteria bacterium GWB1_49_6 TaxID=1798644 RepID=A0A1G2C5F5_9BACT|nr:MAG: hypothetical protein UY56_C0002G0014 [Parcubacteria group bacterium GW2011_GWA1_50_14]OGY96604.1 MAG: hypothetical protein A2122_02720 [Candidatus Liptonbacteria bacterium GWB1_49_6]